MPGLWVDALSVTFPLYHGENRALKPWFGTRSVLTESPTQDANRAKFARDQRNRLTVNALQSLSFSVSPGERLGLVGRNGAGKTTLLRALSGIYEPTGGRIRIEGTLGALLDPGMGMNPELTARENVRLHALREHRPKRDLPAFERDIEAFAALQDFFDLPIKTYSAGMQLRLAFAIATASAPDILLMDEWILAGDAAFQERARARIASFVTHADILVISSHQPDILRQWCTRLIWLENGAIRMDGPTESVLAAYDS